MARHFRGTRRRAALHRVHGRRRHQRLAHGRGAAVGRGRRAHRRRVRRSSRSTPARRRDRRALALCDGGGEIGVISSVTQAFCRDCNRARLSTEGKLYLCLFASRGHDLRALLRGGASDDADRRGDRPDLAAAATTAIPSCAARAGRRRRAASAASRCTTSAAERAADAAVTIRRLGAGRSGRLQGAARRHARGAPRSVHLRRRPTNAQPESYLPRSASSAPRAASSRSAPGRRALVGAVSCERDARTKVRHIGHIIGMMVRPRRAASASAARCSRPASREARGADGLVMLTLTVTAGNAAAVRLYERAGFMRYGRLPRAIRVGGRYHAKRRWC